MSRARKILGPIQKRVPGTFLCRSFLVVLPIENIFRSFMIEGSPEKNGFYFWKFAFPLYGFPRAGGMSHGGRIRRPGKDSKIFINTDAIEETVDYVTSLVTEHIDSLRVVRKPSDFLRYAGWLEGSRDFYVRADMALTHYVIGNKDLAVERLRRIALDVEHDGPGKEFFYPFTVRLMQELESNPNGLFPLLEEWRQANIASRGLEKAVAAGPVMRLVSSASPVNR